MNPDGRQPRILAVDEAEDILDIYEELLEGAGYHITTLAMKIPDLDVIDALKPDLLILDGVLTEGDATREFIEELRTDPATRELPVILCTAAVPVLASMQDQLTAMDVTVVRKPFDIDDLLHVVSRRLAQDSSSVSEHPHD